MNPRRTLLKQALTAAASAPLLACTSSTTNHPGAKTFAHGVASGDPLQERAIIWTRVSGFSGKANVSWQVALDEHFKTVFKHGVTETSASKDFTCKVDVDGLAPDTHFYYRFTVGEQLSPVGRFKTLSFDAATQAKLGLVSCSNYSFGYFNVYRHLAERDDLDAIYHAGDYIYEYESGGYDSPHAAEMGRQTIPVSEVVRLADYRLRHAQYKSDPDLQAVHARHAFICSWDDHEVANDSYLHGAENHNDNEGTWEARKAAALQAYFEWMPVREPTTNSDRNFRSFQFGNLFTLIVLETRLSGRDKALSYSEDLPYVSIEGSEQTRPNVETFKKDILNNPQRHMISADQEQWFSEELQRSTTAGANWQLIGNQTIMANVLAPDMIKHFSTEEIAELIPRARQFAEFSALGLPYNLDAWDGYPAARKRLLSTALQHAKNTVVLTGDTHNAWANDVTDPDSGINVAAEVAVSSVTSPGVSDVLNIDAARFGRIIQSTNKNVRYTNTADRGYAILTITPDQFRADYHFVNTILSTRSTSRLEQSITVNASEQAGTEKIALA
ncbi:MAG: alkaline phosphatase D family protein [Pseudomonadota bacterium]